MPRKPEKVRKIINSIEEDINKMRETMSGSSRFELKERTLDKSIYKDTKLDCTISVKGDTKMVDVEVVDVAAGNYDKLAAKDTISKI